MYKNNSLMLQSTAISNLNFGGKKTLFEMFFKCYRSKSFQISLTHFNLVVKATLYCVLI